MNIKGLPKIRYAFLLNRHTTDTLRPPTVGILGSGATDSFLPSSYKGTNEQTVHQPVLVSCANGSTMTSVATDELNLPSLPKAARSCYKFNDIAEPLISVKKIVNSGCDVLFEATKVTISDSTTGKPVLTGKLDPIKNLYTVPLHESPTTLPTPATTPVNATVTKRPPRAYGATAYEPTTLRKHIKYLHACAGYPTKTSWMKAIDRAST